jgi:translation elongation factor EF-Tu-like GTPase
VDAVRVRLHVLSAEEGGRHSAIATGYRAACWIHPVDPATGGNDGIVTVENGQSIAPGSGGIARIRFLRPDLVQDKPQPGMSFDVREGPRVVARATVIATM